MPRQRITCHRINRRRLLAQWGGLAALLAFRAPRPLLAAPARWPNERNAGVFRCHADFPLDPYEDLLDELGVLEKALARELEIAPPREEIHLFLFAERATYLGYLQQYFPRVPARKALYIKGRGPGMVFAYRTRELAIDVRHESTHALLHASLREVPLWLDEGLAEYYEVPEAERVAKNPYATSVRWNARIGYVPDLEKLETMRELGDMGRNEYRDAWAWVHFLLHGGETCREVLHGYLRQLGAGQKAGPLSEHLRRHIPDAQDQYITHFRRWKVAG